MRGEIWASDNDKKLPYFWLKDFFKRYTHD